MSKLKDPFLDVLLVKIKVTYKVVKKKKKEKKHNKNELKFYPVSLQFLEYSDHLVVLVL